MKKFGKIAACALSAVSLAGVFGACAKKKGAAENCLTIRYYVGGYGKEWLENAAKEFCDGKDGVTYKLVPDGSVTTRAGTILKSGTDVPDIFMTQGGDWATWVTSGYIEPLDEMYASKVRTSGGEKTVAEYLSPEARNKSYMQRLAGQGDYHPYVMPWASLECSIVYNEDMLKKTPRSSTGGTWNAAPETVAELIEYCSDVETANEGVAAFSWSGAEGWNWFEFPIYVWWAQQQGVYESRIEGEGSFYDFFDFASPDVWKQTGIQKAIDIWESIIVKDRGTKNAAWNHTVANVEEKTIQEAEKAFVEGKSAMILGGSFLENEMKEFIGAGGNEKFTMKMMNIPYSENCMKNEDGTNTKINFVSGDDIMFVPSKATNKSLAKEFLAYLCREDQLLAFTKSTGCMRPFNYDPIALTAGKDGYDWTEFQKSCFKMYTESDVNLYLYPGNHTDYKDYSRIFTYKRPTIFAGVGSETAGRKMLALTGKEIMQTGAEGFESVFDAVSKEFPTWKAALGLE